ncbi:hypothetical protein [Flavobacterium sp.]|uniref:hypothetical protein n=1 Tax=Flavobacterium sp. TaxID=239 RepID=UPI00260EA187|nr:hypothetical protein [Flavobacterium sp.]MDG2432608.1 hypothetical protein [Flavobacterium sp.]
MNSILILLLLISLSVIIWHIIKIKKEKQIHLVLMYDLEKKIAFQINKNTVNKSESEKDVFKSIYFKLEIIKQQVALLEIISNQKQ